MVISHQELKVFANNPKNKIALGKCCRNSYKLYNNFKNEGVIMYYGTADYYNDGEFVQTVNHYWNVVKMSSTKKNSVQIIDIYNYKKNTNDEYRNHKGIEEKIEVFKEFYKINERLTRQSNINNRLNQRYIFTDKSLHTIIAPPASNKYLIFLLLQWGKIITKLTEKIR